MNLPKARTTDLLEQEAGSELMIYDLRINKAFSLNSTSRIVFKACHQRLTFDDLKRVNKYSNELIHFALDELNKNNLIEDYQSTYFAGMNRREVIRKVGVASIAVLPIISGLVAPRATHAVSGAVDLCTEPDVIECPYAPTQCNLPSVCNPLDGNCNEVFRAYGVSCDDGNPATNNDICDGSGNCIQDPNQRG